MYRRLGLGSIAQPPMSYGLGGLLRQLGVKPNGGLLMQILAQQYNPYLRAVQPPQFVRTPTATQGIRG